MDEPEYEGMAGFGNNIGNDDIAWAQYLNHLADDLGMDLKTLVFVLSLCMECYEEGLLTREQLDGIDFSWGNVHTVAEMIKKISRRDGIGDHLAENIADVAEYIGGDAPMRAVHIKGGGLHVHDVRTLWGFALGMTVSLFGTTFSSTGGDYDADPEFGPMTNPHSTENQAAMVKCNERKTLLSDCLIVCNFSFNTSQVDTSFVVDALNAVTGGEYTKEEMYDLMDALHNIAKAFHVRNGFTPAQDTLSPRMMQPQIDGPAAGVDLGSNLKAVVDEYYDLMGWDKETGRPYPETLNRLGLAYIAKDLWS